MAVYSKQSFFKCSQTTFPCLFGGYFPSDLDYNINYPDPSYLEQTENILKSKFQIQLTIEKKNPNAK
jgi:hypothetical protein